MDKFYIYDDKLSLKAKGLLTILLNFPTDFKITQSNIKKITLDGTRSIKSAIEELSIKGYLNVEKLHQNGKFEYCYTAEPTPKFLP
jgi:hypothetical protein